MASSDTRRFRARIRDKNPDELRLPEFLWTRAPVCELIMLRFGIRVNEKTAGRYLLGVQPAAARGGCVIAGILRFRRPSDGYGEHSGCGEIHSTAAGTTKRPTVSRTLLSAPDGEFELFEVDVLVTGSATAGPASEDGLHGSLTREQGLERDESVELMIALIAAAEGRPPRGSSGDAPGP